MTFKQLFAKSFHISRRFRMIFYIRFNRLKFWLNDVKFGQNMQVYNNLYLMKCRGNYVKIGGDCIIMDTDAHSLDYMVRRLREKNADGFGMDGLSAATAPIVIEDDVLIGTRCIILKGVTIGARSIIGSGSVVVKSIPADCIAAGNPCKIIRYINGK